MLTFLLGGARSGKSALAEELARRSGGPVTYLATCPRIDGDHELDDRIARHRAERPAGWTTIEEEIDLAGATAAATDDFLVVDCLTLWVNNLVHHGTSDDELLRASRLAIESVRRRSGSSVVVSNEVGPGIVPAAPATRRYRALLGRVNRQWAEAADRSVFLVAGRALPLLDPVQLLDLPHASGPGGTR
ncbi:MAG: bifunctional adenosylcobinamide kinase/adenosylcobinamide-phosphate guanylyltransferase [Ilumatobacteraceae bacterium]